MNGPRYLPPGRDPRRLGDGLSRGRLWLWEMLGNVQLSLRGVIGTLALIALGILTLLLVYGTFKASCRAKVWIDQYL